MCQDRHPIGTADSMHKYSGLNAQAAHLDVIVLELELYAKDQQSRLKTHQDLAVILSHEGAITTFMPINTPNIAPSCHRRTKDLLTI